MCSQNNGEVVRESAAKCLALLGPIEANSVAFSSEEIESEIATDSSKCTEILNFLRKFVSDMDISVSKVASCTLKSILLTPTGLSAWKALPDESKDYLSPYFVSPSRIHIQKEILQRWKESQMRKFGDLVDAELWSGALWTTQNKTFSQWIRLLSFKLCSETLGDSYLSYCATMCLFKVDFASFIFPFAIQEILKHNKEKEEEYEESTPIVIKLLSKCICERENVESLLLILNCLNFLRYEKFRT